jgi:hypothetical protein
MGDTSIHKIQSRHSPRGPEGWNGSLQSKRRTPRPRCTVVTNPEQALSGAPRNAASQSAS